MTRAGAPMEFASWFNRGGEISAVPGRACHLGPAPTAVPGRWRGTKPPPPGPMRFDCCARITGAVTGRPERSGMKASSRSVSVQLRGLLLSLLLWKYTTTSFASSCVSPNSAAGIRKTAAPAFAWCCLLPQVRLCGEWALVLPPQHMLTNGPTQDFHDNFIRTSNHHDSPWELEPFLQNLG